MARRSAIIPTLVLAAALATTAQAAAPGARPGDKEMTCEAVAAERASIDADIARRGEKEAAGAKRKQGFMRFAQGAAAYAPSLLGQFGGDSVTGSLAAQAVGQGAMNALDGAQADAAQRQAPQPFATPEQAARLERLARIAAYRQCAS